MILCVKIKENRYRRDGRERGSIVYISRWCACVSRVCVCMQSSCSECVFEKKGGQMLYMYEEWGKLRGGRE